MSGHSKQVSWCFWAVAAVGMMLSAAEPAASEPVLTLPLCLIKTDGTSQILPLMPESPQAISAGTAGAGGIPPSFQLTCAPGRAAQANLGKSGSFRLEARHFYRIRCDLRRSPRTDLALLLVAADGTAERILPPGDFLVAPVWEPITGFYISPETTGNFFFRLELRNSKEGLPQGEAGLRNLEIIDAGSLVSLPRPREVLRWDRLELGKELTTLPYVPSHGAGVYRIRATVDAVKPVTLTLLLAQGDDERLHWHRTSEFAVDRQVPAGRSEQEWVYTVPDRRFSHQWIRGMCRTADATGIITNLVLEQVMTEPKAAEQLELQSPKYR